MKKTREKIGRGRWETGDEVAVGLKVKVGRKRNFLSTRVVEAWKIVPRVIKRSKTVSSLKNAYRRHREDMVENA